jgi:hypothetical protein
LPRDYRVFLAGDRQTKGLGVDRQRTGENGFGKMTFFFKEG